MNELDVTNLRRTIVRVHRTLNDARAVYPHQTILLDHLEHAYRHMQECCLELDAPGCGRSADVLHAELAAERMERSIAHPEETI